jgi:hypothetical protein
MMASASAGSMEVCMLKLACIVSTLAVAALPRSSFRLRKTRTTTTMTMTTDRRNAEPANKTTGGNQPPTKFTCASEVLNYTMFAANEAEARSKYDADLKARTPPLTPKGPVTCTRVQ